MVEVPPATTETIDGTKPKPTRGRKTKTDVENGEGKTSLSQLDAAAKVLGEATEPLTTKEMVEAMTTKGYWTSPGGKTPHATLYSAILRELQSKGETEDAYECEHGDKYEDDMCIRR